ncbi:hypothetical protein BKP43_08590 [Variovorax boronicumulans]|uniref:hypothetical protein n=1 Tax=Variovorax boronicumulans TaxID=436515 RepID=UPI00117E68B0|nr:hypothetical protein [Variovorax boronicumulans]PBI95059.1 hypothetical protein BKP43_08590 [Variovorax boronicumulans]
MPIGSMRGAKEGRYSRPDMLEALSSPWSCLGAIAGLLIALLLHWLAPADIDSVHAGAWLVGIGWLAGLAWDLVDSDRSK